jgi:hypothetical protein
MRQVVMYANQCLNILFSSYPCNTSTGTRGNWFWLSEQIQDRANNKEIVFRAEFDNVRRIKQYSIIFLATPAAVRLEVSQDLQVWEQMTEWIDSPKLNINQYWTFQNTLDRPSYGKGVRLLLRGLQVNNFANRHGLWQFDFFSQEQTVMILEKSPSSIPRCLARAETGYFVENKPIILMNCLDAIL